MKTHEAHKLNVGTLDWAYKGYHAGAMLHGAAADYMVAAGLTRVEAMERLASTQLPSKFLALPNRVTT